MKVKSLRHFQAPHGMVDIGDEFESDEIYARTLARRDPPWVEIVGGDPHAGKADKDPARTQAHAGAPATKDAPAAAAAAAPGVITSARVAKPAKS